MPKSANQKRKLLVLYRFLLARTDDDHPVTVQEMQDSVMCVFILQLFGPEEMIVQAEQVIDAAGVLRERVVTP